MARSGVSRGYDHSKRSYSIMSQKDIENGKESHWSVLEIRGPIKNLSPELWSFTHLTALFLNDNNLQVCCLFLQLLRCNCYSYMPQDISDLSHSALTMGIQISCPINGKLHCNDKSLF